MEIPGRASRACYAIHSVSSLSMDPELLICCSPDFQRLTKQLEDLEVPFTEDFLTAIKSTDHVIDAIFGLSFKNRKRVRHHVLIGLRFQFLW